MSPRTKRILIISAALLAILALVLVPLLIRRSSAPAASVPAASAPTGPRQALESPAARQPSQAPVIEALNPVVPTPSSKIGAVRIAEIFAERYGSWSNQEEPYQNLRDLYPVMSARYRAEVEAQVARAKPASGAAYDGTTSVKVNSRAESESADAAVVVVTLQQTRTSAGAATVIYRPLAVQLVLESGDWKVDSASWK